MNRLIPQNQSTEKIQYKLYSTLLNILKLTQILKHHIETIGEKSIFVTLLVSLQITKVTESKAKRLLLEIPNALHFDQSIHTNRQPKSNSNGFFPSNSLHQRNPLWRLICLCPQPKHVALLQFSVIQLLGFLAVIYGRSNLKLPFLSLTLGREFVQVMWILFCQVVFKNMGEW